MNRFQYEKVAPPKGMRDLPRYLRELLGGFFFRLFYIFRLVWNAGPCTTVILLLIAIFNGFVPVITSLLTTEILNELQTVIENTALGNTIGSFWSSTILFLLIFFFLFRILHRVIGRISAAATRIAGEKVVLYVKSVIMTKAKETDVSAFDMPDFYEKLENANREAGVRPITILQSALSVVSTVISLISYVVILSAALPLATLCILLVSIPGAIVNFYYRRKNFEYMRRRSKDRRQLEYYSKVVTNKDLVKEVRIYKMTDLFVARFKEVFARYYAGLRKLIVRESILNVVVAIAAAVTNCIFFALIAVQVFQGKIKIGDYTLLTGAISAIASDVSSLISTSASIYEGTLFIDNLISFMKEKPTVVASVNPPRSVTHGCAHTIVFEHVCFRYPGSDHDVLKDINLTLLPGETVVLVGLNGAGKTTLIKLLTRLYDPTAGRILLDGHDLREYDPDDLYGLFGIIFQDFGKYAFTVAENIQFGDLEREEDADAIRQAAINANADDYISRLPHGYDTPLMRYFEPDATELSIGQWQKLSIARAFYSRSDILILDEPTASLDPMAEQEIFNQFDRLRHDKTTVFVSHRLSSATVASKIVVLEYGQIVEIGNHKTLMEQKGRYFELFSTQAKRYVEE